MLRRNFQMLKFIPKPLLQYARFQGRITRSRFLRWLAFLYLVYLACAWIDLQFIAPALGYLPFEEVEEQYLVSVAAALFAIPWLASHIRRLHDVDKSGWWMIFAIPMLLVLYFSSYIATAIYRFLITGPGAGQFSQGSMEMIIGWLPMIVFGLAAFCFSPVIWWSLKKGSNGKNRFGPREQ